MSDRELKMQIEDRIPDICKALSQGNDVEIRTDRDGIRVISVKKTVVQK